MVEEDNNPSVGSELVQIRQTMSLPVGFSIFAIGCGIIFLFMAFYALIFPALTILYMFPAVTLLLIPVIYPIAQIDYDEHGVRFISIRLFGMRKKTVFDFQYDEVDRVECSGYPTLYLRRTEKYVNIQSMGQRIFAGSLFSIEDRKRLAKQMRSQSRIHGFVFMDYVGLIGPQDGAKAQMNEGKNRQVA